MKNESISDQVATMSFDYIGGADVMPIVGFFGPQVYCFTENKEDMPDYFSSEFMQMVADCGVNIISANGAEYSEYPEKTKELLTQCHKFGVGLFVNDHVINANLGEQALPLEEMEKQLQNYVTHPACVGIHLVDEPKTEKYMSHSGNGYVHLYTPVARRLKQLNVIPYVNVWPMQALGEDELYNEYLDEVLDSLELPYLSYDAYPFSTTNDLTYANDYFVIMARVRAAAEKRGIPFWCYVQAGGQWNDEKNRFDSKGYWPEQGSFLWMANTSLAFGAKGIQYFPLLQPYWFAYAQTTKYDFERNGLIGASGKKNRWWYYAQIVNKQIAAVDEVLMNAVNKGVLVSNADARHDFRNVEYLLEGTSWGELKEVFGNTMIGCFDYRGKSAFYVVNYDNENTQDITLKFTDSCHVKVVQDGKESLYQAEELHLTMNAGEGVLVVML